MPSMSAQATAPSIPSTATRSAGVPLAQRDAGYHAFLMLRIAFTVAPIAFGLDKFFNVMVDWTQYLAPWINDIVPGNAHDAMHIVGIVEIAAGLLVAVRPRFGAP